MPYGPMYRQSEKYQQVLAQRELRDLFREDYPDIKWIDDLFIRLKSIPAWEDYTEKDYDDMHKALGIFRRLYTKANFNPSQPRVPRGSPDGGEWTGGGGNTPSGNSSVESAPHSKPQTSRSTNTPTERTFPKTQQAADYARENAKHAPPKPGEGECAKYVRRALNAAGYKVGIPPLRPGARGGWAKDYGGELTKAGFHPIAATMLKGGSYPPSRYSPQKGDVVIIQSTSKSREGHMAIYDGKQWISDFKQKGFWPGNRYVAEKPSYVIYRAPDGEDR